MPLLKTAVKTALYLASMFAVPQLFSQTDTQHKLEPIHHKENDIACFTENAVAPVYPREARLAHTEGVARLMLLLAPNGAIIEVKGVSGDPILVQSTIRAVSQWRFSIGGFVGEPREIEVPLAFTFKIEAPPKPAYLLFKNNKTIRADEVHEFTDGIQYRIGQQSHDIPAQSVAGILDCRPYTLKEGGCVLSGGPSFYIRAIPLEERPKASAKTLRH